MNGMADPITFKIESYCPECDERHTCVLAWDSDTPLDLTRPYQVRCDYCFRRSEIHVVSSQ